VRRLDAALVFGGLTPLDVGRIQRRHQSKPLKSNAGFLVEKSGVKPAADQSGVKPPHSKEWQGLL
jgi:hypothetical protein